MTRILVLYYSQTGQLTRSVQSMMGPLETRADVQVVWQNVQPVEAYPFPWPFLEFFDTFPACVYMDAPAIKPLGFAADDKFDLVVLAYQVWFLSPSLPITGFLASPWAAVLKDTPVMTFIACRNMWLSAQEKMKHKLAELGAVLVDNVVLIDQGPAWATFITTPLWVLTGKKDGYWGLLPPAGVSKEEIAATSRFGRALSERLPLLQFHAPNKVGPLLTGLEAVKVNPGYIAGEKIAHRSFMIWGKLLRALGPAGHPRRRVVLIVYILFLIVMILTVLPVSMMIRAALRPLLRQRLDEQVRNLEMPSGSSSESMAQFRDEAGPTIRNR